ncbi:MAG: ribosome biogenesis GTPase Der [Spirochaetales bacterium]|nr:ribosome biogenesis GTPase Der [Spirochaetales bacterium]
MSGIGWRKNLTISDTNKILPRIVIVGRPNVGKSTLFNRILKKRRAITDPTPGVTRDAIEEKAIIAGREVLLVDTGGYKVDRDDHFDELVAQKSLHVLGDADLILFMLDVNELSGEDEAYIEHLRPHMGKTLLIANKVDHIEKEAEIYNFYTLGFEHIVGISAAHGRNIHELEDKILSMIDFDNLIAREDYEPDIRISILGKPNAGKSTLTNALTGKEDSIVSPIAGTTRDVVQGHFKYQGQIFRVLDTAGIRKKKRVVEDVEYYSVNRAIKSIAQSDVVFLLIDVEEGLSEQDKKIAHQIVKKGKGVILVVNKWDLRKDVKNEFKAVEDRMRFLFPILDFAPIVPISALKNEGMKELLNTALQVRKQLTQRVDTPILNDALAEWVDYTPIPMVKGKNYKIRYITQVSSDPVQFVLFVNRENNFPESYVRYIKNQIKKEFNFNKIPFSIDLKER